MTNNPCPKCGSTDRIVPFSYGEPSPETMARFDRGEVALGGCLIEEDAPAYVCMACAPPRPFGRLVDVEPEWFEAKGESDA